MRYRAVIFDLGGVVFPSPFDAFAEYERSTGLPSGFIREVVAASADHGAWARLERGEVPFDEFCTAFEAECAASGGQVVAAEIMAAVGRGFTPRPEMVEAVRTLRAHGLQTAALTNNWARGDHERTPRELPTLGDAFDVIVESAVIGLRKPDPRIYHFTCEHLGVEPAACVFLDDLGVNLKPARALGMTTIKVTEPATALAELGAVLGITLTANGTRRDER